MKLGIGLDLLQTGVRGIAPPSVVESTWSGTDAVPADWTRTNADKTVQRTGTAHAGWRLVRGLTGHASGKRYFEITQDDTVAASANWMSGIANATAFSTSFMGGTAYGLGIRAAGSTRNGFTVASGAIWASAATTAGNTMMFAVDSDAGKVWIGFNGTWLASGDPGAGTTEAYTFTPATVGALYPAVGNLNVTGLSRFTLKTGTFNYTPPSGFLAWG